MIQYKKNKFHSAVYALNILLLIMVAIVSIYPFYYFLIMSFNDGLDAMKGGIFLFPRVFTTANYIKVLDDSRILDAYIITLFRTFVGTLISLILSALLAYGLTFKELPFRKALTFIFYFTTLFTGGLIPMYLVLRGLNLTTSIWIYILPFVYNFYNIIILRTFFQEIPDSLAESARIDGAGELNIFFGLILPLSKPVLATIALFYGVVYWNDWFTGAFYVADKSMIPAATLLQQLLQEASFTTGSSTMNVNANLMEVQQATTPESLRMTFTIIITLPIVCVYPFLQKYFTKGIMIGSVKG